MLSFYQTKWEAYVGIQQNEAYQLITEIMREQGVHFKINKAPPHFMYDSKHEQIIITSDELTMVLIYVSADPLTRFFSFLLNAKQNLGGITFLSIQYDSKQKLTSLLKMFNERMKVAPWKIRAHPRFQFAFLLELINKRKWKRIQQN
ncbi:hypothetical protein HUG15_13995 [Salicibibacter cibarius]|uniref:Uncharacterized protein n=1 Tax=Salicibibacter cibarius TaxID=2743000 RepID=A0A7T7CC68_9BACI|nr:hypothetical protein [Salicibibacter cibarius]QQK76564.1 hypothetical protein HUG15_13995 [Salicibibacter cibarius]